MPRAFTRHFSFQLLELFYLFKLNFPLYSLIMIAVFLDRDGVINREVDFLFRIEDLEFIPGSIEALVILTETLRKYGGKLIIVSNQSALARGMCTEEEFNKFTIEFFDALAKAGKGRINIDDYYYCPHHPTEGKGSFLKDCDCRKPKPGMLLRARDKFGIELEKSFMVGDKRADIVAGQAVGCFSVLVKTGYGGTGGQGDAVIPDAVCGNLREATDIITDKILAGS